MLATNAWHPVEFPVHQKGAGCRPVKLFDTSLPENSLWMWLYAQQLCHIETGERLPQTVATKLEAHY